MRIAITTLGCKINQYDSAVIQNRLEENHSFVPFEEPADCYIINTCTVTDRADWEARQLVRRALRLSPRAKVLVTGCYAQVNPAELITSSGSIVWTISSSSLTFPKIVMSGLLSVM